MHVSVVLPVRNGALRISRQLAALSRQDYPGEWELVVVNNGSTDDSRAVALSFSSSLPNLRVVDEQGSRGRSAAVNKGAARATGEFLLTCDDDDRVHPSWVSEMAHALESHQLVAGNYALVPEPLPDSWQDLSFVDRLPVHACFLPYAMGCTFGVRRGLFDSLAGLDSRLDGAEDVDFSWRAQLSGHSIGFSQDARVMKGRRTAMRARYRQHHGFGRADVRLAKRFAPYGFRGLPQRVSRQALWAVANSPRLVDADFRLSWVGVVGRVFGAASELHGPQRGQDDLNWHAGS